MVRCNWVPASDHSNPEEPLSQTLSETDTIFPIKQNGQSVKLNVLDPRQLGSQALLRKACMRMTNIDENPSSISMLRISNDTRPQLQTERTKIHRYLLFTQSLTSARRGEGECRRGQELNLIATVTMKASIEAHTSVPFTNPVTAWRVNTFEH